MLEGTELWVRLYRLLIVLIISWLIFEKSDLTTSYSEENFIFLFPEAVRIENDEVFDQDDRSFGYFLTTSPQCDHLKGYSGPTNLALALDKTGKLVEAKIIESSDTPDHVQSVVDDSNFWKAHASLKRLLEVKLYVTGLTPCLTATLLAAENAGVESLILMHYDRESGKYIPQNVSALL